MSTPERLLALELMNVTKDSIVEIIEGIHLALDNDGRVSFFEVMTLMPKVLELASVVTTVIGGMERGMVEAVLDVLEDMEFSLPESE